MQPVSDKRWKQAQAYERDWWTRHGRHGAEQYINHMRSIHNQLLPYIQITPGTTLLQIGCAAEDVVHYWTPGKCYALDPLVSYFESITLMKHSEITRNICAMGELLPFKDNQFDIILLNNVLDHCRDPNSVLSEIHRVLRKNGLLYFEVTIRPKSILPLLTILWKTKLSIARGHPFIFSDKSALALIKNANFHILSSSIRPVSLRVNTIGKPSELIKYCIERVIIIICQRL